MRAIGESGLWLLIYPLGFLLLAGAATVYAWLTKPPPYNPQVEITRAANKAEQEIRAAFYQRTGQELP